MSSRRFAAYFFAIVAGSTFTFASTLRGQPPEPGAATQENLTGAGVPPTAMDAGLDVLPPGTAARSRQGWERHHHAVSARTARAE